MRIVAAVIENTLVSLLEMFLLVVHAFLLKNKAEVDSKKGEMRSGKRMYLAEFSLWSEMYVSEAIVKALPRALPIRSVVA